MSRLVIVAVVVASFWVALSEATMQPTSSERMALYGLYGAVTVVAVAAGAFLRARSRRFRSFKITVQVIAVSSVLVAGLGLAGASPMFIEVHDLRLMLVSLGLGMALGLTVAVIVGGTVTDDLDRIATTARLVAGGDTSVRTNVSRADEIGATAEAVDEMVVQLGTAHAQRQRDDQGRREFLAAIGHDLRTPLSGMRAGLEAMQDGLVADEGAMVGRLLGNVETLERLVDDLSILGRVESGGVHPVPLDLSELVDETVDSLMTLGEAANVRLQVHAPQAVMVQADAAAVGRVIRNLVDNAIRYASAGSAVQVAVEADDETADVSVSDDGPGFDPDFREVAFDRFTTNDPSRTDVGSGLGLAIAKSVIAAHEGTIGIDDGSASVVRFRLPILK